MQHRETVEEYLNRGGKINRLSPSPAPQTVGAGFFSEESPAEPEMVRTVSWRELYEDVDPEYEDRTYWTKLNKKLDKALKKLGEKSEPTMTEESPLRTVPEHVEKGTPGRPYGIAGGKHHRVGKK